MSEKNELLEEKIKLLKENGWIAEEYEFSDEIKKCIDKCKSPNIKDIFNAFELFKADETRLLILGQDPYPNSDKAQGVAFSCKKGKAASLTRVFKILDEYYNIENKKHNYNLVDWSKENKVFLLNTSLTYESKEKILSNVEIWEPFVVKIIENLVAKNKNLVCFLWGEKAKNLFKKCKNTNNIKIFETCHPLNRHDIEKFRGELLEQIKEYEEMSNNYVFKNLVKN